MTRRISNPRFRNLRDPESLRQLVQNLQEGIYITTLRGEILDANPAFLAIFGATTLEELSQYSVFDVIVDPARRAQELELIQRDGTVREFELSIRRLDGEIRTVMDTCFLVRDPETGEGMFHGILIDITARKALEARLLEMSTHDPLTGALNRRYLTQLDEALSTDPDAPCGCVFVDIDHFKLYNDRHGHQAGDEVLVRMVRFLMRHIRAEESVVRVGGDEFVILLRGAGLTQTERVANRLREAALTTAPVPFSLGWAAREQGEPLSRLVDRADRGLMKVRVENRHAQRQPEQDKGSAASD
jgi:diguanylate cyclase (GGDEF)-like protein/PAS domain S-box-containing protein